MTSYLVLKHCCTAQTRRERAVPSYIHLTTQESSISRLRSQGRGDGQERPSQPAQKTRQKPASIAQLTFVSHGREQICRGVRHAVRHRPLPRSSLRWVLHVNASTAAAAAATTCTSFSRGAAPSPCAVTSARRAGSAGTGPGTAGTVATADPAEGLTVGSAGSASSCCSRHPQGSGAAAAAAASR